MLLGIIGTCILVKAYVATCLQGKDSDSDETIANTYKRNM